MTRRADSSASLRRPPAPDTAWRAVVDRDRRFDSRFVYGVSSTGVFCRPSCASRRPRRDRVRFFADASAARDAGFRACKRCRPQTSAPSRRDAAVAAAVEYLHANTERAVTLAALATHVGLSPYHLQRAFTGAVGVSPAAYRDALRHRRFVERLRAGDTVSRATYAAGFGSSSRVYGRRDVRSALAPAEIRRRAPGRRIQFVTVAVPLGRLLVAFTDAGVCAVELGSDDATLEQDLRANFANARVARARDGANAWVRAIAQQAAGRDTETSVPLDVQGTAFQWKVWRALQRIPFGETRTYADVAVAVGKPSAVRAVANACARNPVALTVPCHRVVRTDGTLGGYRWGVERKRRLLDAERTAATRSPKAR